MYVRIIKLEFIIYLQGEIAAWIVPILQDCLRLLYQRALLEQVEHVLPLICQVYQHLLCHSVALLSANFAPFSILPRFGAWCLSVAQGLISWLPPALGWGCGSAS